jgi:hypothetical protein
VLLAGWGGGARLCTPQHFDGHSASLRPPLYDWQGETHFRHVMPYCSAVLPAAFVLLVVPACW